MTAARARRVPAAAAALSHARIRDAALALIDRDGLDAFSTRKLGLALGCEAMAIYWYYPSKEALLDAVVDALMAGIAVGAPGDAADDAAGDAAGDAIDEAVDWVTALRGVAVAYRGIAHAHPRAFPLLATRRFGTESTFAFLEQLFELSRRQGIPDRTTAQFFRIVSSYCNGFALNELAVRRGQKDPSSARKRFPRVAAVSVWLEPKYLDETFAVGLEVLLAALAERGAPANAARETPARKPSVKRAAARRPLKRKAS